MLPIYISYFTGQSGDNNRLRTIKNALGFVAGFTLVFVLMGAFAGTLGSLLIKYNSLINIISGVVIVLFGLNFLGVINIPAINVNSQYRLKTTQLGFISSVLFGIIFSVSWTPCVGAFLGSALMMAASEGERLKGILMLLSFSFGLGIPFLVSALLIDKLKSTFDFIKKHYRIINYISGGMLVIVGILMATGFLGYFLSLLSI